MVFLDKILKQVFLNVFVLLQNRLFTYKTTELELYHV